MPDFPQPIEYDVLPKAVMDFCTLAVIGKVAHDVLTGARLMKVTGLPSGNIILTFDRYSAGDGSKGEYSSLSSREFNNWIISADPVQFRVHPVDDNFPKKSESSHLIDVLSHHLSGSKVDDVEVVPLERIISFAFSRREYTGEILYSKLIVELMGKHSNIILVDPDDVILATFKPVHSYQSRVREIRAGKPYKLPPRQDRITPGEFNSSQWADFIRSAGPDISIDDHIARTFHGMSNGWARAVAMNAGVDPEKQAVEITPDESERLRDSLVIENEKVTNCIALTGEARVDFVRRVSIDFAERAEDFEINRARRELMRVTAKRRKKLTALGKGLGKDIERAGKADGFKRKADLLLANMHNVLPGVYKLEVTDWETNETVMLELDLHRTPQMQAENWYKRYRKLKRTEKVAAERRNAVLAQEKELKLIEDRASSASSLDEISEVRRQCVLHGLISERKLSTLKRDREKKQQASKKSVIGGEIRSKRYRSNDGFLIVAGLNDRANDALRRASSNEDIWLHTRNIPGGHVYIITRGRQVPETTIKEAAIVAAWHSRAKDGSNVPVDYTKAKYLTPVPGGPAGKVIFRRERTIRVTPDEKRVEMMGLMAGSEENNDSK